MEEQIKQALTAGNYGQALGLYAAWSNRVSPSTWAAQHKSNAASLARKHLYDRLIPHTTAFPSIQKAVDCLVGLSPFDYERKNQQPNFLYVPGLKSKPFWQLSDINGLNTLCADIAKLLKHSATDMEHRKPYIGAEDTVPSSPQWDKLKQDWHQTVVLKGGEIVCSDLPHLLPVAQKLLDSPLVAQCPPHAPEAFFSQLKAGAYIPPHFGISNIKLTVHIPLIVNELSSITVGEETKYWIDEPNGLVFDDSFLHEAKNQSNVSRVVFIFDVWHPELTLEQRQVLQTIMNINQQWQQDYGHLAILDS